MLLPHDLHNIHKQHQQQYHVSVLQLHNNHKSLLDQLHSSPSRSSQQPSEIAFSLAAFSRVMTTSLRILSDNHRVLPPPASRAFNTGLLFKPRLIFKVLPTHFAIRNRCRRPHYPCCVIVNVALHTEQGAQQQQQQYRIESSRHGRRSQSLHFKHVTSQSKRRAIRLDVQQTLISQVTLFLGTFNFNGGFQTGPKQCAWLLQACALFNAATRCRRRMTWRNTR
jgi:hypothetical protein